MSRFSTVKLFSARLAPHFADSPESERLYEVVTADGERIASASTSSGERQCVSLAEELNAVARRWAERVGFDAVLG